MDKNLLLKVVVGVASFSMAVPVFTHGEETIPVPVSTRPAVQDVKDTRQDLIKQRCLTIILNQNREMSYPPS